MSPSRTKRAMSAKDDDGRGGKLSLLLLGLAGLGVGVWLFRSKRRKDARQR